MLLPHLPERICRLSVLRGLSKKLKNLSEIHTGVWSYRMCFIIWKCWNLFRELLHLSLKKNEKNKIHWSAVCYYHFICSHQKKIILLLFVQRFILMSVKWNTQLTKNFKHNFTTEISKYVTQQMTLIYSSTSLS